MGPRIRDHDDTSIFVSFPLRVRREFSIALAADDRRDRARQLRAAEREIAKHLHLRCGRHHDDFKLELERRLLGQ
jgi:hypothetical protein